MYQICIVSERYVKRDVTAKNLQICNISKMHTEIFNPDASKIWVDLVFMKLGPAISSMLINPLGNFQVCRTKIIRIIPYFPSLPPALYHYSNNLYLNFSNSIHCGYFFTFTPMSTLLWFLILSLFNPIYESHLWISKFKIVSRVIIFIHVLSCWYNRPHT